MTEPSAEALLEHAGFLRALARSLLLDEGQAEDVVQETYLAAIHRPPPAAGARGWLAAVTRNLALKRLRAETRARRRETRAARADALPAAGDVVAKLELHRLLVDAVQRLDEPYRAAIVHRYFEDLPPREIARSLGIPVRAVETRLRRALERLRGDLDAAHAGDRRAWSLPLLALLPLPRSGPLALAGVLMTKTHLLVAGAVAAICFLAGWTLGPKEAPPARGARETASAAVPDAETERLKQELAGERAQRIEAEEKLRAALAQAEEQGVRGRGGDAAAEETAKGPRFPFPEYEKVLGEIDWEEVGTSTAKLNPLLVQLLEQMEKTGNVTPELLGEVQKWNAQLVAVALKVQAAGLPGHGINGSFTNPAVDVNVIHAMLKASGNALGAEQEAQLSEIGRRYVDEEARRAASYPEGTLELRKVADEAAVKDRFYAEVDGVLSAAQRELLHPEAVRGLTQLDLFSSGIMTYLEVRPVSVKDRELAVKQVTDRHMQELGLDATTRPVVESLVRRWAERVAEAGLDGPRERNVGMPLLTSAERVKKVAQLQLELWDELQRQVALTAEQRAKLAAQTNIVVPFR
ncbi:MAG TPA: sigma-70 family RNA polymerase sigma factor [Planctomycetota bacterium]|nr:sigma-70 family RNA polymerase sigma factor [Planctomycetota bacterium]